MSNSDIEWGVSEGKTYTWKVIESAEILGTPPKDSTFELTITSINHNLDQSEVEVTLKSYNSKTESEATILNEEILITCTYSSKEVRLYKQFLVIFQNLHPHL